MDKDEKPALQQHPTDSMKDQTFDLSDDFDQTPERFQCCICLFNYAVKFGRAGIYSISQLYSLVATFRVSGAFIKPCVLSLFNPIALYAGTHFIISLVSANCFIHCFLNYFQWHTREGQNKC
ncbi:hypothetical protein CKAN_02596900 [Cinnamomum micranthum f. kanehirae]|uniref:Uncharacterized protein n=1 Tax=Cinnamomum micranthum f. kanehirae TaxID=337451 RepID=A0A3S3PRZ7_9MAGN|nr:hypothetical protein CKAN_02596900 [Cinnamomum micranthum f. kanehirae]